MKVSTEYFDNLEETDWLVKDLIARESQTTIFGKPGIGKSLLALDLAAKISHDEPVLYLDYEMSGAALRDRLESMGHRHAVDNGLHYYLYAREDVPPLDTAEGGNQLYTLLRDTGAKVVFIDAMAGAVKGGENDNDTYREFDQHTGYRMRQAGVTSIRIDHQSVKTENNDAARGASRKLDDVDLAWAFMKTGLDGHFMLRNKKNRMGTAANQVSATRTEEPLGFTLGNVKPLTDTENEIVAFCDRMAIPTNLGRDRLREALAGTGYEHHRNSTLQNIVRARKSGDGDRLPDPF